MGRQIAGGALLCRNVTYCRGPAPPLVRRAGAVSCHRRPRPFSQTGKPAGLGEFSDHP